MTAKQSRRPLMVLGCTSSAGKSLLVTALARWFCRNGVDVAPFKAQNMSNNARVVDGGEIGVAQWLQAAAAGVDPTVDMNPILLKPEADTRSHVIVGGRARPELTRMEWRKRGALLWPIAAASLDALRAHHELVLIEGAGSPAEINLVDFVNNGVLNHADARALLVADIDRGGAFAHLYGTWALVPDSTRTRLQGFILNKFRGDAELLHPGPAMLRDRTGMELIGVMPMLHHELPDEEGATVRAQPPPSSPVIAIVRYPYASNLDEFHLLAHAARVRFAEMPTDIDRAELVVLPGSKHVAADVAWLRSTGLASAITARVGRGGRVVGICGGCMMLGERIDDRYGIEGAATGLGVLPLQTEMRHDKIVQRITVTLADLPSHWAALEGRNATGYEIRHGRVITTGLTTRDPHVWASGPVLATTVHGLFEDPDVIAALTGVRPKPVLARTFDALADAIDQHLDTSQLWKMVQA